jgi:hypothetical protein
MTVGIECVIEAMEWMEQYASVEVDWEVEQDPTTWQGYYPE